MWWTEWHWDGFFSKYFSFPLLVWFYQCSILILIFVLALPEGQTDEAWEPANLNAFSEIGQRGIEKFLQFFLTVGYGHCCWPSLSTASFWERCQWSISITLTKICSTAPRGARPQYCLSLRDFNFGESSYGWHCLAVRSVKDHWPFNFGP
jgi:hypothetical protein